MIRRSALRCVWLWVAFLVAADAVSAAVVAARVTVGTTPTLITRTSSDLGPVLIKNAGTVSLYLGGPAVTTATGYELGASETVSISLAANEEVYGVVGTGTVVVHKLENRR